MLVYSAEIKSETGWIGNLQLNFIEVRKTVGAFLQKQESLLTTLSSSIGISNNGIKLERMRMPMFNGNIREHLLFTTDFIKQVQSQIEKQEREPYTLKSCLIDIPYDFVKNVDNDLEEMWKRLDDRYGRTSKLT